MLTAEVLIAKGANLNQLDTNLETPLHGAVREGHLGMTLMLLTNGADVNIVSPYSATPLHVATIYRRTDIAKVLKEHGSGCQGGRRCACMPQGVPIP